MSTIPNIVFSAATTTTIRFAPEVQPASFVELQTKPQSTAPLALQSCVLQNALTFAVNHSGESPYPVYSLSVNDSVVVARPRDPARLADMDHFSQHAAIQLGEFLANVQFGIHRHGYGSTIELLPIKNRIDPLATIRLDAPMRVEPTLSMVPIASSEHGRYEVTLSKQSVAVQLVAELDLIAQAMGVWAQAMAAVEALPESRVPSRLLPDLAMLGLAPESTLLAIYAEGNSLLDWLLVGQAIARMKQSARGKNIGVRQLSADTVVQLRNQVPWRHTLQFTQLQALLHVGRLDVNP